LRYFLRCAWFENIALTKILHWQFPNLIFYSILYISSLISMKFT
jgi:hypothetical protein